MRNSAAPSPVDLRRRDFLIRFCQGASAALIPAGLRGDGWPTRYGFDSTDPASSNVEFHLNPHYRTPKPLDGLLLKTQAGLDDFVTEKYADQIANILAQWSSDLLQSPQYVAAIEKALLPNFSGSSLRPFESRVVRPGPEIEVRHNTFKREAALGRDAFLQELRSALTVFSKILTAEFHVTSIYATSMPSATLSSGQLQTRIRYEVVGTGHYFHREQRDGYWQITWERSAASSVHGQNRQ